jgi:hypothetical protein
MMKLMMSARVLGVALALMVTAGCAVTATAVTAGSQGTGSVPGGPFGPPRPLAGIPGLGITGPGDGGLRLSCPATGDCGAIGTYTAKAATAGTMAQQEAFVVTEASGHWGKPQPVAGLARLNTMGQVSDLRITCPAPGDCAAGGAYATKLSATSSESHAFVVQQRHGTWGQVHVFGTAGLAAGSSGASSLDSLSCSSPGNCVAGADYGGAQGSLPFIVVQQHGTWGAPQPVPGVAALIGAQRSVVSEPRGAYCADSRDCTIVGDYPDQGRMSAFIATEAHGVWTSAAPLPGLAALASVSKSRYVDADALACDPSGRDCTAAGVLTSPQGRSLPFAVAMASGRWGTATVLPGTGQLNLGNAGSSGGGFVRLSCPAPDGCTVAFTTVTQASPSAWPGGNAQVYLESEVNGAWGGPRHLGGVSAAVGGGAQLTVLSCGAPGACTFGGSYGDGTGPGQAAFLATLAHGRLSGPRKLALPGTAPRSADSPQVTDVSCAAAASCTAAALGQSMAAGVFKATVYLITEGAGRG